MKCKNCNVWGCQHRTSNAEQECVFQNIAGHIITQPSEGTKAFIVPEGSAMTIDWQSFRREAAKDILCSLLGRVERITTCVKRDGTRVTDHRAFIRIAIEDADELIRQLKEEKK